MPRFFLFYNYRFTVPNGNTLAETDPEAAEFYGAAKVMAESKGKTIGETFAQYEDTIGVKCRILRNSPKYITKARRLGVRFKTNKLPVSR
ncbi:MAG: hypothetical protein ACOX8Q_04610 [Christensenellales bacterium]